MQVCTTVWGNTAVMASGKPFQAIDDGDQDVLGAAVLDLVHHPQPELGALGLLDPKAQHFLVAGGAHADRQVHGLVLDQPLVADLDPQRIEEHDRVAWLQRPACQAVTSSMTESVTAETRSGETSMP